MDIVVVWTKVDSKKPVFVVNVPTGQTRSVTSPSGIFDEYLRAGSWYYVQQDTLKSGSEYRIKYYWKSNGPGLESIPDSEAPEI
ncbi:hypothetical protein [Methanosarcina sp. 1.H.A.2.2]|uniref:hypothetical protein n=1 Tax=Methanosarcina sp. 1.H.A.2.2 TaxID=1483601 RepID=UPI000AD1ED9E|nr:hypothetical protein [Methanosarcina sp. 1.H.A.2.2]